MAGRLGIFLDRRALQRLWWTEFVFLQRVGFETANGSDPIRTDQADTAAAGTSLLAFSMLPLPSSSFRTSIPNIWLYFRNYQILQPFRRKTLNVFGA